MCDIFPLVENCCLVKNLRIAMLFISVLAITTGGLGLSICEQRTNTDYASLKNVTLIKDVGEALSKTGQIVGSAITASSILFMATGVILLFATLSDEAGFVQVFVWVTFANVIICFLMLITVCYDCTMNDECILSDMDWLTGAIVMVILVAYLFVWLYFISVANSYVVQVF